MQAFVDAWEDVSQRDPVREYDCDQCGEKYRWGIIKYYNGYEDWLLMCPACGNFTGDTLHGNDRIRNIYSRKYGEDIFWHIQWNIVNSARYVKDPELDLLRDLWEKYHLEFEWGYLSDDSHMAWKLENKVNPKAFGLYTINIRKKNATTLRRAITKMLEALGYEVIKSPTFKYSKAYESDSAFLGIAYEYTTGIFIEVQKRGENN